MNKKLTIKNGTITIKDGKITIDFDENNLIEETSDICTSNNNRVELSELNPGDEFFIGSSVYVVVDHIDDTTKVISKEITDEILFNAEADNDYSTSDIRDTLNSKDYATIAKYVGAHNIVPTSYDTTALDGSGSYGVLTDNIGILSLDEYRKYYNILNNIQGFNKNAQWLITPHATRGDVATCVCVIDRYGTMSYRCSNAPCTGVRPFFTLKSSTKVEPRKTVIYDDDDAETD